MKIKNNNPIILSINKKRLLIQNIFVFLYYLILYCFFLMFLLIFRRISFVRYYIIILSVSFFFIILLKIFNIINFQRKQIVLSKNFIEIEYLFKKRKKYYEVNKIKEIKIKKYFTDKCIFIFFIDKKILMITKYISHLSLNELYKKLIELYSHIISNNTSV